MENERNYAAIGLHGMQQGIAQKACEPIANASPLKIELSAYGKNLSKLSMLCARLVGVADDICGSRPENGESGRPSPVPNGIVEMLHEQNVDFEALLGRMQEHIDRLTRL